ncbi:MAG: hypothetical protein D6694_11175 [Gammaproteobacteria bacterium]|nr:MAG: hypothetical protein D6694_11175 [Gammaproteobacteria bacterium]
MAKQAQSFECDLPFQGQFGVVHVHFVTHEVVKWYLSAEAKPMGATQDDAKKIAVRHIGARV